MPSNLNETTYSTVCRKPFKKKINLADYLWLNLILILIAFLQNWNLNSPVPTIHKPNLLANTLKIKTFKRQQITKKSLSYP